MADEHQPGPSRGDASDPGYPSLEEHRAGQGRPPGKPIPPPPPPVRTAGLPRMPGSVAMPTGSGGCATDRGPGAGGATSPGDRGLPGRLGLLVAVGLVLVLVLVLTR